MRYADDQVRRWKCSNVNIQLERDRLGLYYIYQYGNQGGELKYIDLQHELFRRTFHGQLFLAPIMETPQRVLDFGTGMSAIQLVLFLWPLADNFYRDWYLGY
jgi:hypothetical protein